MVSAVTRKFVFVFYLHRERCGLLVRLSQLPRKRTPFPNNLVPGLHLVHFGAFTFSLRSTSAGFIPIHERSCAPSAQSRDRGEVGLAKSHLVEAAPR